MRIAAVSDIHFGDPMCALVANEELNKEKFDALMSAIGTVDYFVLLGDVLDFSIQSCDKAYASAKVFFDAAAATNQIKNYVYVPGNHDYALWNAVEHNVNVASRIINGKPPRRFKYTVPGVLDDRAGALKFVMPDVGRSGGGETNPYGTFFLSEFFKKPTFVAYPNLYLVTNQNESFLFTHGQYFEAAWAFTGERAMQIADGEEGLVEDDGGIWIAAGPGNELIKIPELKDFVAMNYPINEFLSSGIGMAGNLTTIVRSVQRSFKDAANDEERKRLKRYFKNIHYKFLNPLIQELTSEYKGAAKFIFDAEIDCLEKKLAEMAKNSGDADARSPGWTASNRTQRRMINYLNMCSLERERIRTSGKLDINVDVPAPNRLIFGHTHSPIKFDAAACKLATEGGHTVYYSNAGSFLYDKNKNGGIIFKGAEAMIYDSDSTPRFFSKTIF